MAAKNLIVTPQGRAIYPWLHAPDTKFDSAGVYRLKLAIGAKASEELISKIDAGVKQAMAEAVEKNPKLKGKKIKEANLPYAENPENPDEMVFSFKMKASGVSKKNNKPWSRKPNIYDAKNKPCDVKVGGGSIVRVSFELSPFYTGALGAGVSLRLEAVKVIELREFGGNQNADSFGFEEEEGFESDGVEKVETPADGEQADGNEGAADGEGGDF